MSRKYPHFNNCKCGSQATPLTQDHVWYWNAPDYHNCFWTYLRHNPRVHTFAEVSKFMNLSISAVTTIERKALEKYKKRLHKFLKEQE